MGDILQIIGKFGNLFKFQGTELGYVIHTYNKTWRNERSIELPIVRHILSSYIENRGYEGTTLEVGNVTQNYYRNNNFDIVDQFEKGERVINEDIFKFKPKTLYDNIVAISTVEHFHEHTNDPLRGIKGIKKLMSFLAPQGILVFTVPAGFNKVLDSALYDLPLDIVEMKKVSYGLWEQCHPGTIKEYNYDYTDHSATGLYVCVYKK